MLNKLHINNVWCDEHGMYIAGLQHRRDAALQREIDTHVGRAAAGHAQCTSVSRRCPVQRQRRKCSALFRRETDAEDRALAVPEYDASPIQNAGMDQSGVAQTFARGLCALSPSIVAGGSSPSTVSVYDLAANQRLLSVNLTMDVRNAIHGLAVWPYG